MRIKYYISLVFFLFINNIYSHGNNNVLSDKHVNISGTKIFIIPPTNFIISDEITGLKKDSYTAISFMDLTDGNYYTNASTFTRNEFESNGINVLGFEELKINNYPARIMIARTEDGMYAISTVFGDITFSVMINSFCPISDTLTLRNILKSYETIVYNKKYKIDPKEIARFTINENNTRYKFTDYAVNIFIFKQKGTTDTTSFILINQLPYDSSLSMNYVLEQTYNNLLKHGLKNGILSNQNKEIVNGKMVYFAEINGKMKNEKSQIYIAIMTNKKYYFSILSSFNDVNESNKKEFKNFVEQVSLK